VSKTWVPIHFSGIINVLASSNCTVPPFTATIFYTAASGLAPTVIPSPSYGIPISDMLALDNVTLSFGVTIMAGPANPYLMWYNNASKGAYFLRAYQPSSHGWCRTTGQGSHGDICRYLHGSSPVGYNI
jgi:hypothetical protein